MRVCNCDSVRKGGRERLRESMRTLCERDGGSATAKSL